MLLLNDKELLEGITGATGFILFNYFLREHLNLNPVFEMFIAWVLVWYFRKIVINIYVQQFKNKGLKLTTIKL